jgi:hypothetical protein
VVSPHFQVALADSQHGAVREDAANSRCVELLLRPRLQLEGAYDRSVFTVASFASPAECQDLSDAAHRLLDSYGHAAQPARSRLSIVSRVDRVLRLRLLALLEAELPAFAQAVFGQNTGLADLRPEYSPGEPAVNIYTTGGEFAPHTDKQSVTLLVPLSAAFEGGGTAFWPDSHHRPRDHADDDDDYDENCRTNWLPHSHMLAPPAGTAIIFGGNVTHAGLPVTAGIRHLFVMSFTLRPRAVKPASMCSDARPRADCPPAAANAASLASSQSDEADCASMAGLSEFADLFA